MSPVRVQRKRTKGSRMPENTVYVGRPTFWGNMFSPVEIEGEWWAQDEFDTRYPAMRNTLSGSISKCVDLYRSELTQWSERHFRVAELAGKDLACWCPLDQPCHADVLLEIANRPFGQ